MSYSPMSLLAIAILATAAGMRGYAGFATWTATAPPDVLARLGIRVRRPSEKTFRSVLSRLDPVDLGPASGRLLHHAGRRRERSARRGTGRQDTARACRLAHSCPLTQIFIG